MTEEENIDLAQKLIAQLKAIAKEEIQRAKDNDDARLVNAWSKAFHKTGAYHTKMTDLLLKYHPNRGEVVTRGPGGR